MANKIPNPEDIQKDVSEFLKSKYGESIYVPEPDINGESEDGSKTNEEEEISLNFDLRPEELEAYLKEFIVGQEEAIEVLSTKICTHFNRMKFETSDDSVEEIVGNIKNNVLMIGPTGVGKTYLLKLIAKRIGVPFVKGDATKFSETGYVGGDVEDLIRDLVKQADGNIKHAEYGIVYLDEIDKIASHGSSYGPDVSRTGVQRNLLKLMEEAEVDLKTPHDLASQMEAAMQVQKTGKADRKKINTKNILFVMSGAFNELGEIIKKRLRQQTMGFGTEFEEVKEDDSTNLKKMKTEDLLKFGFESEFVGRLPVTVVLNNLDVAGLLEILRNPKSSVIKSKKRDFEAYNINVSFDDEALKLIAELAIKEKTGARGLVNVFEKVLLKYEKRLPSTVIKEFTVSKDIVKKPEKELNLLINKNQFDQFVKEFFYSTGIALEFAEDAKNRIIRKAEAGGQSVIEYCNYAFKDYELGLKLLKKNHFIITNEIIEEPHKYLDEIIKKNYSRLKENNDD